MSLFTFVRYFRLLSTSFFKVFLSHTQLDPKGCGKSCEVALNRLENIDDDAERHGIQFVKSTAVKTATRLGIDPLPALVFFEDGQPVRYNGKKSANRRPTKVVTRLPNVAMI